MIQLLLIRLLLIHLLHLVDSLIEFLPIVCRGVKVLDLVLAVGLVRGRVRLHLVQLVVLHIMQE